MLDKLEFLGVDELLTSYFVADITIRSSDGCYVLYVPKDRVSEVKSQGLISKKQLSNLQDKLNEQYKIRSEVLLIDSEKLDKLKVSFETLLQVTFPDDIADCSIEFLNAQSVSVEVRLHSIERADKKAIQDHLELILSPVGVSHVALHWIDNQAELPSMIEVLSATKRMQPATIEEIINFLSRDYEHVGGSWLNRQLDKLIKKKLVVREKETATYCLTFWGLNVLPSASNRNNSDIVRALDLGRRKWSN
ncbi:hypothetical protein EAY27_16725 [Vibrio anguillarum]|uniref:hypothetical protein n=1 Tax=Vibrio anguillarum TaxID=55601 RepID=UPI00188AE5AF|nr:hypothetical protein [Vibrio anguillarum]MBF4278802.1 hypothetical protein [Vibrio anguillarum]MBF4360841.1 hypothetical protein [Vibrio anguillarum]